MEVRLLRQDEKFDARMISALAFHGRVEDPEKERADSEKDTAEDWGAFGADGRLAAHIIRNRYEYRLDGQWVKGSGIGAVSTLPEYRGRGAIRAIFGELLSRAYREGEVLSSLYPFNHAFYRKFGYETVCWQDRYAFSPSVLREYSFRGEAEPLRKGDSAAECAALYDLFARGFNLSVRRDGARAPEEFGEGWPKDRRFFYLLREGGKPVAYLAFRDVRRDSGAVLAVRDYAWDGGRGFRALLGFLARFSADYGSVEMTLPSAVRLPCVIHAPDAYDIRREGGCGFMVRAVSARLALEKMAKPADCDFTVRVTDPLIPENCGVWRVTGDGAVPSDSAADLEVSVQAFSQLVCGAVSLREALLREDARMNGNEETLERVFRPKPILVTEAF